MMKDERCKFPKEMINRECIVIEHTSLTSDNNQLGERNVPEQSGTFRYIDGNGLAIIERSDGQMIAANIQHVKFTDR